MQKLRVSFQIFSVDAPLIQCVNVLLFYCAEMTDLVMKRMEHTPQNRSRFRAVARDSCGETFEPESSDIMFFGAVKEYVVAVGSCRMASAETTDPTPSTDTDSAYAHVINYVFIRPHYQGNGYGRKLLRYMEDQIEFEVQDRPFRLKSCRHAVEFFERLGYHCVSEPVRPVCPGSKRFAELYSMEKL